LPTISAGIWRSDSLPHLQPVTQGHGKLGQGPLTRGQMANVETSDWYEIPICQHTDSHLAHTSRCMHYAKPSTCDICKEKSAQELTHTWSRCRYVSRSYDCLPVLWKHSWTDTESLASYKQKSTRKLMGKLSNSAQGKIASPDGHDRLV
jgi:hypothetical protein